MSRTKSPGEARVGTFGAFNIFLGGACVILFAMLLWEAGPQVWREITGAGSLRLRIEAILLYLGLGVFGPAVLALGCAVILRKPWARLTGFVLGVLTALTWFLWIGIQALANWDHLLPYEKPGVFLYTAIMLGYTALAYAASLTPAAREAYRPET